jgi:hypothetical protein
LTAHCELGGGACAEALLEMERHAKEYPCVGCGYCCRKTLCWEGQKTHPHIEGGQGPCPELVQDEANERYWCGLLKKAVGDERNRIAGSLFIGTGCCSSLNSDRERILQRGEAP